jgi:PPE-repeat protein
MQLIATNILGQNAPAIAATQADYAQMWAQDAAAMYQYSASSAAATQLTPLTSPEQASNPAGTADQAAATAHAAANAAGNSTPNALSAVPQTLQQLALPLQAAPVQAVDDAGLEAATATGVSGLSLSSAYHTAIGSANFFQRLVSQFGFNQPQTTDIKDTVDKIALATGAVESDEELQQPGSSDPFHGFGSWQNWLKWLKALGGHAFPASATAGMDQASTIGGLSVPQSWAAAAPEIHLAAAELPSVSVDATPAGGGSGTGSLAAQAALAGMAGRALAGTVAPGGGQGTRSTSREGAKPSADAAKEIAAALREYASLRDSGIITDTEFNKQKEHLMSLDPLSGR